MSAWLSVVRGPQWRTDGQGSAPFYISVLANIMRVLALVPSIHDTSPGQRYRIEQWQGGLTQLGVEITFAAFEDQNLRDVLYTRGRWLKKGIGISKAFTPSPIDCRRVKVLRFSVRVSRGRTLRSLLYSRGWCSFRRCRWYSISMMPFLFAIEALQTAGSALLKAPGKTGTICRLASHVIVGNNYLAEYARTFNRNVTVVPTTIDTDTYRVGSGRETGTPVIGWTGSYSTVQHLDLLRSVLSELARSERFRLRVIGPSSLQSRGS